jgi:hypothetical protein
LFGVVPDWALCCTALCDMASVWSRRSVTEPSGDELETESSGDELEADAFDQQDLVATKEARDQEGQQGIAVESDVLARCHGDVVMANQAKPVRKYDPCPPFKSFRGRTYADWANYDVPPMPLKYYERKHRPNFTWADRIALDKLQLAKQSASRAVKKSRSGRSGWAGWRGKQPQPQLQPLQQPQLALMDA